MNHESALRLFFTSRGRKRSAVQPGRHFDGRRPIRRHRSDDVVGDTSRETRRGRLVVDILPALKARADRIRQYLREALHFGRSVWRVDEAGAFEDGLEPGHD